MFYDNYFNKPAPVDNSSQGESITIPGQAPSLKYIVNALANGETLNIRQSYKFDSDPSMDTPNLPIDLQSLGSDEISTLLESFNTPKEDLTPPATD